jgi:hypothetical protein
MQKYFSHFSYTLEQKLDVLMREVVWVFMLVAV